MARDRVRVVFPAPTMPAMARTSTGGFRCPWNSFGRTRKRMRMHRMSEPHQASHQGNSSEADAQAVSSALEGGKYVYCIIRSDRPRDFGSIGIGGGQRR